MLAGGPRLAAPSGMASAVLRASCRLFSSGQSCAECPQRGLASCPLPDIEDLFMKPAPPPPPHATRRRLGVAGRTASALRCSTPAFAAVPHRPALASHEPIRAPAQQAPRSRSPLVPASPGGAAAGAAWKCTSKRCAAMSTVATSAPAAGASHLAWLSLLQGAHVRAGWGKGGSVGGHGSPAAAPSVGVAVRLDEPEVAVQKVVKEAVEEVAAAQEVFKEVELSTPEGKRLFEQTLAAGGLESYFALAQQVSTQPDERMAPLSTLSMVLNALNHDPGESWKGPWRWNDEASMLCGSAKCGHTAELLERGVALGDLAALARCRGVRAVMQKARKGGEGVLRQRLAEVAEDEDGTRHMVVSAAGGGSCTVGGYSRERDMVLLLDVARHVKGPRWVSVEALWAGMRAEAGGGHLVLSLWNTEKPTRAEMCPPAVRSWSEGGRGAARGRRRHPARASRGAASARTLRRRGGQQGVAPSAVAITLRVEEGMVAGARAMHTQRAPAA